MPLLKTSNACYRTRRKTQHFFPCGGLLHRQLFFRNLITVIHEQVRNETQQTKPYVCVKGVVDSLPRFWFVEIIWEEYDCEWSSDAIRKRTCHHEIEGLDNR